jgi:hypothetical protein
MAFSRLDVPCLADCQHFSVNRAKLAMRSTRVKRAAALFLLTTIAIVGCGEVKLSEVSGTVIYDGKGVEQGSIAFIPIEGNGPSGGGAIKDGKYIAQNVHTGMTKVRISGAKVTGQKRMFDDPNSPLVITSAEYLPSKYNKETELTYEVRPGNQTKDFDLVK